ncbi:MAG TPA: GNAT family N-acetyltransferase [Solirubrobacteraceae bacterium]
MRRGCVLPRFAHRFPGWSDDPSLPAQRPLIDPATAGAHRIRARGPRWLDGRSGRGGDELDSHVDACAEREGEVVGVAVSGVAGAVGWIYRLTVSPDVHAGELAQQLLSELELKLAEAGARKMATVLQERSDSIIELVRYGYRAVAAMRYLERELPAMGVALPGALE